jgi:hypothetical protein
MNKVLVAVRIRPLSEEEISSGSKSCCKTVANQVLIEKTGEPLQYLKSQQATINEYAYDYVFGERSTQSEVYTNTTEPFLRKLINGENVTVFAYGATGAGKTHTMFGNTRTDTAADHADAGIIPNSLRDLFRLISATSKQKAENITVSFGYVEVYNEQVYDLLDPTVKLLQVREDQEKGIVVAAGMNEMPIESYEEALELIAIGTKRRKTEATLANQVSSRSHAIIQIQLRKVTKVGNHKELVVSSKLSLIDLAGSERASATNNRGIRLQEGAHINKSLLALANCINSLAERNLGELSQPTTTTSSTTAGNTTTTTNQQKKFVNVKYRDSKLTHLLKNSLEGNSNLIMIANINPSTETYEDSHNTLKYANRAKNIRINPLVKEMLKEQVHHSDPNQQISSIQRELQLKEENTMLKLEVERLKETIAILNKEISGRGTKVINWMDLENNALCLDCELKMKQWFECIDKKLEHSITVEEPKVLSHIPSRNSRKSLIVRKSCSIRAVEFEQQQLNATLKTAIVSSAADDEKPISKQQPMETRKRTRNSIACLPNTAHIDLDSDRTKASITQVEDELIGNESMSRSIASSSSSSALPTKRRRASCLPSFQAAKAAAILDESVEESKPPAMIESYQKEESKSIKLLRKELKEDSEKQDHLDIDLDEVDEALEAQVLSLLEQPMADSVNTTPGGVNVQAVPHFEASNKSTPRKFSAKIEMIRSSTHSKVSYQEICNDFSTKILEENEEDECQETLVIPTKVIPLFSTITVSAPSLKSISSSLSHTTEDNAEKEGSHRSSENNQHTFLFPPKPSAEINLLPTAGTSALVTSSEETDLSVFQDNIQCSNNTSNITESWEDEHDRKRRKSGSILYCQSRRRSIARVNAMLDSLSKEVSDIVPKLPATTNSLSANDVTHHYPQQPPAFQSNYDENDDLIQLQMTLPPTVNTATLKTRSSTTSRKSVLPSTTITNSRRLTRSMTCNVKDISKVEEGEEPSAPAIVTRRQSVKRKFGDVLKGTGEGNSSRNITNKLSRSVEI